MKRPHPEKNCSPPARPCPNRAKAFCASSLWHSPSFAASHPIPGSYSPLHIRPARRGYVVSNPNAPLDSPHFPSTPADNDPWSTPVPQKFPLPPLSDGKMSISPSPVRSRVALLAAIGERSPRHTHRSSPSIGRETLRERKERRKD